MSIRLFSLVLLFFSFSARLCGQTLSKKLNNTTSYTIVIHGGAGVMHALSKDASKRKVYKKALLHAITIGDSILENGGSSLDAVEKTIRYMEDNPLFNAGRGAVYSSKGINELDASIMSGINCKAGAVGGVTIVKHPISAARAVMEKTKHVLLVTKGAEEFAKNAGLEIVPKTYFQTRKRNSYKGKTELDLPDKWGTVGCVALDKSGHLAAGTSTGGLSGKKWGRIGDSPIIGAGTYADDKSCAVSCTGIGEFFIRYSIAFDISARMKYKHISLEESATEVIRELTDNKGSGGIIAVDNKGNFTFRFNTPGMFRAYSKNGQKEVFIFK